MQLTKYAHACVTLTSNGRTIAIDPGAFTPDAAQVVAAADAVLITHDHFDHFDAAVVRAALTERPGLPVYAPQSVREQLGAEGDAVVVVEPGDAFEVAGFSVTAHGGRHAMIHRDIPQIANVGYLVDEAVYHPGDAYFVPEATVGTLLLPTSGPWTKLGEAADFVRAVGAARVVQIHELMLSELGRNSTATILGENGLTGRPILQPAPGETLEL